MSNNLKFKRKNVALLIETSTAYARGLIRGILNYVRDHDSWSIVFVEQERGSAPPAWMKSWHGDGIIARIESAESAAGIQKIGVPVVDVSAARQIKDIPWVETDDNAIAKLAFQHFFERGFRSMAYCSESFFNWSRWREEAFKKLADQNECEFHTIELRCALEPGYSFNKERVRLQEWLEKLPRPIAIMGCYDRIAQQVADICRDLNIRVPEEIAIIGVDNDEILCNASNPPLSSVIPDAERSGYEAARILDELMQGKSVPAKAHLLPPLGIAARRSSDVYAIDDPMVARAISAIRDLACTGAKVSDLLSVVPLSRRVLEARFRKATNKTPHDFLLRFRIERAQALLSETDLSLSTVAERSGFGYAEYLSTVFQKEFDMTPGTWRKENRDKAVLNART
jgi:LacI family transcriptional regulator